MAEFSLTGGEGLGLGAGPAVSLDFLRYPPEQMARLDAVRQGIQGMTPGQPGFREAALNYINTFTEIVGPEAFGAGIIKKVGGAGAKALGIAPTTALDKNLGTAKKALAAKESKKGIGIVERRDAAFEELGDLQRGKPESAGGANLHGNQDLFFGNRSWTWLTEHVGDLTHRMTHGVRDGRFGVDEVSEKVRKTLAELRKPNRDLEYLERDRSTYDFYREDPAQNFAPESRKVSDLPATFEEFRAKKAIAGQEYADAHRELPVYNEAQFHGREAAIAVGEQRLDDAVKHLEVLERQLKTPEKWDAFASKFDPDFEAGP